MILLDPEFHQHTIQLDQDNMLDGIFKVIIKDNQELQDKVNEK